jgi:hypothetical protein
MKGRNGKGKVALNNAQDRLVKITEETVLLQRGLNIMITRSRLPVYREVCYEKVMQIWGNSDA